MCFVMILDYHKICPPTVTIIILKHYKRLSVSIFDYNTMQKAPNFLKSLFTIVICYCSSRPAFIMLFALSIWASLIRIDWYGHRRICIIHYQSCFLFHCLKALTIEKAGSRKNKFFLFLNFVNCIRLASLPFIITSSCASLDTDAGFGVYKSLLHLNVWKMIH